jgi:hypothetical protein
MNQESPSITLGLEGERQLFSGMEPLRWTTEMKGIGCLRRDIDTMESIWQI